MDPETQPVVSAPTYTQTCYCRACGSSRLEPVLDFGSMPLANRYLTAAGLDQPEPYVPLQVMLCCDCGCVQLSVIVDPAVLYSNYLYTSSTSGTLAEHFRRYACETTRDLRLNPANDFIVGIGGNDGPLELVYQRLGFRVLNVEAAANIAKLSEANGVPTLQRWFGLDTANEVVETYGHANVVTCNNCFAHMPDLNGIIAGVKRLLRPRGWFIIESADLEATLRSRLFDQFYHEHVFYWTVPVLARLFRGHRMQLARATYNHMQGGSFRVMVCNTDTAGPWDAAPVPTPDAFDDLGCHVRRWTAETKTYVQQIRDKQFDVACYGWPAKATLLATLARLDDGLVHYAVDDSPVKQGLYTPGSHIPIVSRERFVAQPPDVCLVTASNYAAEIEHRNPQFKGKWQRLLCPDRA